MQAYLGYLSLAMAALIFFIGFGYSRRRMKAGEAMPGDGAKAPASRPGTPGIYEAPGVNQQSGHPLGAAQSVIYGRIRFAGIGVALFALYALHIKDFGVNLMDAFGGRTPLTVLALTVILIGAIVWGLRLMSYATYRVRLRRTGFELASIFGTEAYAYRDVDFYLSETMEHRYASEGYRPFLMKSQNHNGIWVCQVLFHDGRAPIMLKSSRYAWLKTKIMALMEARHF